MVLSAVRKPLYFQKYEILHYSAFIFITKFVLNVTKFVLNVTKFVLNVTKFVLNVTHFQTFNTKSG